MKAKDLLRYIKTTEKMVVPEKVASATQGSTLLRKLPLRLQRYIVNKGARTNPYMSFIVEPYGVFLDLPSVGPWVSGLGDRRN